MNVGNAKTRMTTRLAVLTVALALILVGFPKPAVASGQVELFGYARDSSGAPIANCYIDVSDENYTSLKNTYTNEEGYYELSVPECELYHLWAGKNDAYLFVYVPQSKMATSGQVDFNLEAGANIIINAYNEQ